LGASLIKKIEAFLVIIFVLVSLLSFSFLIITFSPEAPNNEQSKIVQSFSCPSSNQTTMTWDKPFSNEVVVKQVVVK
jgi:hypothetical protein